MGPNKGIFVTFTLVHTHTHTHTYIFIYMYHILDICSTGQSFNFYLPYLISAEYGFYNASHRNF